MPAAPACANVTCVNPGGSDGDLLWAPSPQQVAAANVTAFTGWLGRERGLHFDGYHTLWRWSVTDLDGVWQAVWDYFGIASSSPPARVLDGRAMPGATAGAWVCAPAQAAGLRICARTQDRFIDAQIVIKHSCAGVSRHLASEAN